MPLIRLPPPTGVEPQVSTRPSDPRQRGEGICRDVYAHLYRWCGKSPLPRQNGERVRGKPASSPYALI
ncbi:hypothetical protein ELI15_30425 [Rhizobium ruizarguesonis]|nr:hypothetical protein ELI15_30425 [Rhizobium ruizarguesonis]